MTWVTVPDEHVLPLADALDHVTSVCISSGIESTLQDTIDLDRNWGLADDLPEVLDPRI